MADVTPIVVRSNRHEAMGSGDVPVFGAQRPGSMMLGRLLGANMNSTADQAITIGASTYVITQVLATNASTSLTLAAGGLYTAASKGGTALVAAAQVYSGLTASGLTLNLTLAAVALRRTEATLYLSLTLAQGGAATADLYLLGIPLD